MFDKNILTFNPGWNQDARKLDTFTDVRELQRQLKSLGVTITTEADESSTGPASFMIEDPEMAARLGLTHHANVAFNGNDRSLVSGMVLEISDDEFARVDEYEAAFHYARVSAELASGREAWVYVHHPAAPGSR